MTRLLPKYINGIELPKQLHEFANQALKDHTIRELAVAFLNTIKGALSQSSSQVRNVLHELLESKSHESKAGSHSATALIDSAIEKLTRSSVPDTAKPDAEKRKKKTKAKSAKARSDTAKAKTKKTVKSAPKPKSKSKTKPKEQPAQ